LRPRAVPERAPVAPPRAPANATPPSDLHGEGRRRDFDITVEGTGAMGDGRVLDTLAVEMDADIYTQTPAAASADLAKLPSVMKGSFRAIFALKDPFMTPSMPAAGQAILATWRQLIDNGSLQDEEPHLKGTQRTPVARLSAKTAEGLGGSVKVFTERGAITLPVEVSDLPDGVVWLPGNSDGSQVRASLGAGHGAVVSITGGGE
ncbi:NADH-quinone oxidoreductase subunit G, partial [Amycolatopsis sp. H20-H5]|nr:NADH-quinone oxidoreductase subunit G [Amycolatopsis sp. H20-H5]